MSATLTDRTPERRSAEGKPPTAGRIAVDAVILVVLLGLVVILTDGWFSADEVVMNQQSSLLVTEERWTVKPDPEAEAIDPDHLFPLLARSDRIGAEIAPYTKHPIVPAVVAVGEQLGGSSGRYVPGALAVLGASMLLAHRFGWSRPAFWFLPLGTTAVFHVSVVWAHAPAVFFATAAAVLLFPPRRGASSTEVLLGSAAVAATALFRSEGLLLGAGLSASMFLVPLRSSGRRRILAIGPILASVLVYLGEPLIRAALFGASPAPLAVPVADSNGWDSRLDVARIMLVEPSIVGGLGSLRLIGVLALVTASVGVATRHLQLGRAYVLLIGAGACYLVGVLSSPIPGLLVAMPLITAVAGWVVAPRRHETGALVAAGVFALGVIATSYDGAGGGDWGARYLFIGVPLLAIALVPAVERMRSDDSGRVVLAAAVVCALTVQAGVLNDLLNRGDTVETVDSVAASVERELSSDSSLVAAVSDERLSRFIYDRGVRGRVFHVPPLSEDQFFELDGFDQIDRVLWVDIGSIGDARSGEVVETHGSVSIRTEVRR